MSEIAQLEEQKKLNRERVEIRDAALRLYKNRDFRKLIIDGFCKEDAARYVQLSEDPSLDKASQTDALNIAQASGHFKRYMSVICRMGDTAEAEIMQIDETLAELRHQDADDREDAPAEAGEAE